jgi:Glyoxalase-like domain
MTKAAVGPTRTIGADGRALEGWGWGGALGYQDQRPPEGYASWEDWARAVGIPEEAWNDTAALVDPEGVLPRLFIQRVPEPKTAKNRVHLDLSVSGGREVPFEDRRPKVDAAVERLIGLGATKVRANDEPDQYWVVMQDPEGNDPERPSTTELTPDYTHPQYHECV